MNIRKLIREEIHKFKSISDMTDEELAIEYRKLSFAKSKNQPYDEDRLQQVRDEVLFNRKIDLTKYYSR